MILAPLFMSLLRKKDKQMSFVIIHFSLLFVMGIDILFSLSHYDTDLWNTQDQVCMGNIARILNDAFQFQTMVL